MVERTNGWQSKEINQSRIYLLNNSQSRILLRLLPSQLDSDFPRHNVGYLEKVLNVNYAYLSEILDVFMENNIVSLDGDEYYISQDGVWKLQMLLSRQAMISLAKRIDELKL